MTTSLRGLAAGTLDRRGADRGRALGRRQRRRAVVVSHRAPAARPARGLARPDAILPTEFHCAIPAERVEQAQTAGGDPGRHRRTASFRSPAARSRWSSDRAEAHPQPHLAPGSVGHRRRRPAGDRDAGNVLRPQTALKLSLRLPPTVDGGTATRDDEALLEADPPHGATRDASRPIRARRVERAADRAVARRSRSTSASQHFYGKPAAAMGEGGTIPFMAMLGKQFPRRAVPDHRRARPEVQRARPERVPARALREQADGCVAHVIAAHRAAL